MVDDPLPPSLLWRAGSTAVMGFVGTFTRAFMHGPNWQDAHGLDGFLELLDKRADIEDRKRGLITGMITGLQAQLRALGIDQCFPVSNHISVYVRITKSKHHDLSLQKLTNAVLQH